jgi:hypothetical protein
MTPLRRRMIDDMTLRNFTPKTIEACVRCVARFAHYFHCSPARLGPDQVRADLLHLLQERDVSLSYYNQVRCALRFLYQVSLGRDDVPARILPAKQPRTLPVQHHRTVRARGHCLAGINAQPTRSSRPQQTERSPVMNRPRLTVAEVIRSSYDEFLGQYGRRPTPEQHRALKDLTACRTAALGGHVLECPGCGHQQIAYNSCGNRHCPTCQATAAARWMEARAAELLPVPYFHLVFTLPNVLGPIALANPRVVYDLLLRCAAARMIVIEEFPPLSARLGQIAGAHACVVVDSS